MANEEKKTEKNKPKTCPKWLSAAAKKEWRRIAKIFAEEEKEFTDKDLKALEAYCTNYAKWQKCEQIIDEKGCSVVDLPGIYSLRPYTQEEIVSRDFILNQKPDGIINIVDATNIERNLYLTLQLLELRIPMVLALNMMDEVRSNGGSIDVQKMSASLGIPVVPIAAAKGDMATI